MLEKDSKSGLKNDLQRLTKSVNRLKEQNLEGEAKTLADTISQSLSSISKQIESSARDSGQNGDQSGDQTGGQDGTSRQQTNQPNALNPTIGSAGARDSNDSNRRSNPDQDNKRPGSRK